MGLKLTALAQETEMIPQRHKDTGNREDPDSCLSDFITCSEFTEFNEILNSFRKNNNEFESKPN